MQKIFTLVLALCLLSLAGYSQTKYFKGELKGSNEVPANAATGFGVVLAEYNVNSNQLELRGDYQGLTGTITASHIHNAAVGVNGAVMYSINNTSLSAGSLALSVTLTEPQEVELLEGRVYVNVHTAANAGGELRTQLVMATVGQSRHLQADLSGANEVPPTGSGASGVVYSLLDKGEGKIYTTGLFAGLSANASAAHLHTSPAGSNGPVTFPLNITTGLMAGVFSSVATVTPTQITDLEAGNVYCNVHTSNFPLGEIRGQLAVIPDPQIIYFKGLLSGAQEVPAVATSGFGVVLVQYDLGTNSFILTGDYQNLTSLVTASHIHAAAAGANGGVLFNLTNTSLTSGNLIVSTTITDAQEAQLLAGNFYANVHTVNNPGGEVRAQLSQTTDGQTLQLSGIFSGTQEVPPNASAGTGAVNSLLDMGTNMLYVTGIFSGLGTPSTAAHLHKGAAGVNGGILFPLNFTPGLPFGVLSLSTAVDAQTVSDLKNGLVYANVHTTGFGGGEIRAQLGVGSGALPVKLLSFNGYRNADKIELSWTVDNQKEFKDFTIEQVKGNTQEWMYKGTVAANNLSGKQTYYFTDIPTVESNVLLYRLKMTDVDGKKTYSSIVKINFKDGKVQLVLLSNPIKTSQLRFQLTGVEQIKNASASVVDMSGRTLARSNNLQAGTNSITIDALPAGMYKLVVLINGESMETSFIK